MARDERAYLLDIVQAADLIGQFLAGKSFDDLVNDELLSAAVLQKFIVIGEAGARLSSDFKSRYSDVPWHKIVGLRNVAVHGYFAIDWTIIWSVATADVASLASRVEAILRELIAD